MVVLFGIIVACLIFPIGFTNDNDKYLEKNESNCIKGLASLLVVYAHAIGCYRGQYDNMSFYLMNNLGFLSVGIFYMMSGYGLMYSCKNKADYLKGYFKNRVLKVLIPFWIVNCLYIAFSIIAEHEKYDVVQIVKYILGIELITGYLWFVPGIVILYCLFWVCCKIIPDKKMQFCLMLVIFSIFNVYMQWKITMFVIGLIMAYIGSEKIYSVTYKIKRSSCLFVGIIFCIMYFCYAYMKMKEQIIINENYIECICQIVLCIFLVLLTGNITFKGKLINVVGKASYEIFLVHRLLLDILKTAGLNVIVFLIVGIAVSVVAGYAYSYVLGQIKYKISVKGE